MVVAKSSNDADRGMNIDSALVRELAELLGETGLTEIEVEDGERKVRVARQLAAAPPASFTASAPPPPMALPADAAAVPQGQTTEDAADALKSPMVGTVYMASEPSAEPFIKIGSQVKEGDTLLIVEAMKVMNPITADRAGTITAIFVDNAQPVEFDQPLVIIA